jgi:hypothetical protein
MGKQIEIARFNGLSTELSILIDVLELQKMAVSRLVAALSKPSFLRLLLEQINTYGVESAVDKWLDHFSKLQRNALRVQEIVSRSIQASGSLHFTR